jgi:hypothetical protein
VFGQNIAILSNSVGSSDDMNYDHAKETEVDLSIAVVRHKRKKPDCLDEVLEQVPCLYNRSLILYFRTRF